MGTVNFSSKPKDINGKIPVDIKDSNNLNVTLAELVKKADILDFIVDNYEKSGFGTLSKSEIDLIFFTAIYKDTHNEERTDYHMSRRLQITQTRVRNMKEKASVKYLKMDRSVAIDLFLEKVNKGHFHEKYIDIPLYDIAVKNEIEAILEENNMVLHTQLNPKIFRLAIEDILDLLIVLETTKRLLDQSGTYEKDPDLVRKTVNEYFVKSLKDNYKKGNKATERIIGNNTSIKDITLDVFKEGMSKGTVSLGIHALSQLLPGGFLLKKPLETVADAILG